MATLQDDDAIAEALDFDLFFLVYWRTAGHCGHLDSLLLKYSITNKIVLSLTITSYLDVASFEGYRVSTVVKNSLFAIN